MSAEAITRALGGRWHGRYGSARCPAHEDRSPSLSLADGADGRLLVHCFAGCEGRDVLAALRAKGLLASRDLAADRRRLAEVLAEAQRADRADLEKRARQARECWAASRPIRGTPAEAYLGARGIPPSLALHGLRFHPECWHSSGRRLPAMVALVEGSEAFAVHRTYLRADGSGKAPVEPAKASLGPVAGGAVRLSAAAGPLLAAEGIESALSAGILLGRPASAWAALSAGGMAGLRLPQKRGEIIIAMDSDDAGAGAKAGQTLALQARRCGWRVFLWPAPEGQDWNDVLRLDAGVTTP